MTTPAPPAPHAATSDASKARAAARDRSKARAAARAASL